MSGQPDFDWAGLWSAWARAGGGLWAQAVPQSADRDPVDTALENFRRFAETVSMALNGVAPDAQASTLARWFEALSEDWDGADAAAWAAVPFKAWSDTVGVGDPAWTAWLAKATAWAENCLALPSLGPQREWQAGAKTVVRAALRQQAAERALAGHHVAATRGALKAFAEWLNDEQGPPVTSLHALFDGWVACADGAFQRAQMAPDYARDFGAWVNAGSALRQNLLDLHARAAGFLGLPDRGAFDELVAQQARLRAEITTLRSALVAATEANEASPAHYTREPDERPNVVPAPPAGTRTATRTATSPGSSAARGPRPKAKARAAEAAAGKTPKRQPKRKAVPRPADVPEFDIGRIVGQSD